MTALNLVCRLHIAIIIECMNYNIKFHILWLLFSSVPKIDLFIHFSKLDWLGWRSIHAAKIRIKGYVVFPLRCPNKESVGNRSITLLACVPNSYMVYK